MSEALTVVKVGGSLYDLTDLRSRLQRWLDERPPGRILLVPGGGRTADLIRAFDALHGLGDERAHWLALRALTLNAFFLAELLPDGAIIDHPRSAKRRLSILDAFAFVVLDERLNSSERLPHAWVMTSDSVAACAAVVGDAARLILLKSAELPQGVDWIEASRAGFVDGVFADVVRRAPALVVEAINFRL